MNEQTQDDGGTAFPMHERDDALRGMPLRDYFASHEDLNDCLDAADNFWSEVLGRPMVSWQDDRAAYVQDECEARAKLKLMRADAMLKARAAK